MNDDDIDAILRRIQRGEISLYPREQFAPAIASGLAEIGLGGQAVLTELGRQRYARTRWRPGGPTILTSGHW